MNEFRFGKIKFNKRINKMDCFNFGERYSKYCLTLITKMKKMYKLK